MIDVSKDIHSLTAFKRQTNRFARMLKTANRPMVLTVDGKARFVLFDAATYEEWNDRIETLEAVNEALAEDGKGRSAADVHEKLRKKHFGAQRSVPKAR
jgi:PHD/YefM family antitoxin component YafN of YafNO toxin-antitoxin module